MTEIYMTDGTIKHRGKLIHWHTDGQYIMIETEEEEETNAERLKVNEVVEVRATI